MQVITQYFYPFNRSTLLHKTNEPSLLRTHCVAMYMRDGMNGSQEQGN